MMYVQGRSKNVVPPPHFLSAPIMKSCLSQHRIILTSFSIPLPLLAVFYSIDFGCESRSSRTIPDLHFVKSTDQTPHTWNMDRVRWKDFLKSRTLILIQKAHTKGCILSFMPYWTAFQHVIYGRLITVFLTNVHKCIFHLQSHDSSLEL